MDLSAKVLREVEFRDRLRGYDTDEVDEFLEKVAVAVEELRTEVSDAVDRADRAERALSERAVGEDEDSIRRTLILAQRTADLAIREAQEQSAQLIDNARSEAEKLVSDARENAERLTTEADRKMREDVARLEEQRDKVRADLGSLTALLDAERTRLAEALGAALRVVERTLAPSPDVAALRPMPGAAGAGPLDELEEQINEDAAAAAPTPPPAATAPPAAPSGMRDDDLEDTDAMAVPRELGRSGLTAVPPLEAAGPDTEAWHRDDLLGADDPLREPLGGDAGSWRLGAGRADWTA